MIMNPTISTSATPLADKLILGSKLNPVEGKKPPAALLLRQAFEPYAAAA